MSLSNWEELQWKATVVVHTDIIWLRFHVQLLISFPVLMCYSLNGMCANLGTSFVLILSYTSDRRELSLSEYKSEKTCFSSVV